MRSRAQKSGEIQSSNFFAAGRAMALARGAAWMDGRIVPISEAKISVTDWGLTHADSVYDVVPAIGGAFFRLDAYLERFAASMRANEFCIQQGAADIRAILHELVSSAGLRDAYCAMVACRGTPAVAGSRDPRDCRNHFYAWAVPYVHILSAEVQARGASLRVAAAPRIAHASVSSRAKNYMWGDFTRGLLEAKAAGYDNTLLLDGDGAVTEGPGFNIFCVAAKRVVTPEANCLEGITRRCAIEICERSAAFLTWQLPAPYLPRYGRCAIEICMHASQPPSLIWQVRDRDLRGGGHGRRGEEAAPRRAARRGRGA